MELGTLGEWVSAGATVLAAAAALYLGARDEAQRATRNEARRTLHRLAKERLQWIDRWDHVMVPDGDLMGDAARLDHEAAEFVGLADALSRIRAWRADRILRSIYGNRSVDIVRLYPDRWKAKAQRPDANKDRYGNPESVHEYLLRTDPSLVTDDALGPLRRRGAGTDVAERARLRAKFAALTRI